MVLQKVDSISQTHVENLKEFTGSVKVPGVSYYSCTDTQANTMIGMNGLPHRGPSAAA